MKKIRRIGIAIILIILVSMTILFAFSKMTTAENWIGGVDFGIREFSEVKYTVDLAWLIANFPEKFVDTSAEELLNLSGLHVKAKHGTQDIYYYTCHCWDKAENTEADASVRAVNVIELETPGKITIYKKGVETPVTIDLGDFDTAKRIYQQVEGTSATFTEKEHAELKKKLSIFIYANYVRTIYKANDTNTAWVEYGGYDWDGRTANNEGNFPNKVFLYTYWHRDYFDCQGIGKYIEATGLLDSAFLRFGTNMKADLLANKFYAQVKDMQETPTLKIQETTPVVEYKNGKAYVGPLKATYTGGTPIIKIAGNEVKWVTKNTSGEYSSEQASSQYTSGQTFYAVMNESDARNIGDITVNIELAYQSYKAKILLTRNGTARGQQLYYHAGKKYDGVLKESWTVEQGQKIKVLKQDENGNTLNVAGIKFEVYDSNNKKVGTLTTKADGTTNALDIEANKTYTLKEITNNEYGYKRADITEASIVSGKGNLNIANGVLTFNTTQDTTIAIKNTKELGNLVIHKTDENDNNLKDVEFAIYKAEQSVNTGYVKLSEAISPIITDDTGLDITKYTVTYVATAAEATKFKTNESGKIVINNLEIYAGASTKYNYWICETENNNYGYKNMPLTSDNITVTGGEKKEVLEDSKEIKVTISENTTVKIVNKKEVGKLTIEKKGDNNTALKDVEFAIYQAVSENTGYLKLNSETLITTPEDGIDITKYTVSYVEKVEEATKFKTNESGKVIINNLEIYLGVSKQYNYYIQELTNNNYGYKHMTLTEADITVTGGEKLEVRPAVREVKISITDNTTVTIKNTPSLGNIKLSKVDKDTDTSLSNVEFKVIVDANKYLQLKDKDGKVVEHIEKAIAINKNNIANDAEYSVEYIDDSSKATIFVTDSEGKITINNLEVYSSSNTKYTYKLSEIKNPNYGYTISSSNIETGNIKLENEKTSEIKLTNEKALGGLSIVKADKDNQNLLLENVEFVLSIDKEANTYIALYNKAGLVKEVKGTATVNVENKATETEYIVKYVKLEKSYLEYTEAERKELGITIFKTGSDGKILINNLAVKDTEKDVNYKYRLTETKNPYYGYEKIDGTQYFETTLTKGKIASSDVSLTNSQETFKISGYVWVENSSGKQNNYDGVYTNTAGSEDIKLKDFYIVKNGEVVKNTNSSTPIEIKLRDKTTKTIIKEKPDEFTSEGKYTFTGVEISKLANYEVIFIYDGFYYTTIVNQPDKENGSKVKEVATERETLNNKFTTIQANSQVVSKDGTVNTVQYYKDGHTSTLVKLNFATTITATTGESNFNLKAQYDSIKSSAGNTVQEIENVNLGIVLREQPKISLNSDIYGALIEFEGYNYNYKYNGRQNYYENVNNDDFGVKFEEKFAPKRYTRTVYASDIQAAAEKNKEIKLSITYKIQIANESKTLSIMPKQIINYFDARYTIKGVGLGLDESTHTITNNLSYSTPQNVEGSAEYKSTIIDFSQLIAAGKGNVKHLYITFDVSRDAILDLLNNKSTYHNASEIISYASYYGTDTAKADGKQYITDQSSAGAVYAGIDKMSQPGNMEISLINHPTEQGTQILDTTYFEDDTSSAPSLLLEATESRIMSGTVWEDSITNRTNNQKLGDGIYQANEKVIKGVKVELRKVNADGSIGEIATYSNGDQVTAVTDENGTYTFGHYDEQNKKYVGILPGKYVVVFTYNNQTYIVGSKNISVNDYKSTIITSNTIEKAFNGQNQKWYLVEEASRYSDARDDIKLRPEYDSNIATNTVTNSTYNNMLSVEAMKAYTPVMDIGIEFTEQNTENALTFEFVKHYKGVDFGIVERPSINMEIQKQITGLEIVAQNGTTIIPKGDPSDLNTRMQYVKKLDGLVSVEIDAKLLQGAKVNLEYTITLKNSSDRDYIESDYYYYGRNGKTEATARPKLIVDYLDGTISLDTAQNGETWSTVKAKDLYRDGYINEQVYKELQTGKYNILTTTAFEEVGAEETKSVKLYAAKYLAVNDKSDMDNRVEIIEITGKRTIKESIPGNYVPTEAANEQDEDKMDLLITRPTGSTTNYIPYIIATIATFVILVSGIVIIKKKVIKS